MLFLGQAANYSASRILRHLFATGSAKDSAHLRSALAEKYDISPNNVALYHSGRSALAVAISSLAAPNTPIVIPGLTCIAVIRAIKAAGCTPIYCDINRQTLQYDHQKLAQTLSELPQNPKKSAKTAKTIDNSDKVCYNGIIIVQNTLGLTCEVQKIQDLAKKHNFAIIEDLAHSAGREYPDGRTVGSIGDAVILSFGKGKAIDTITGGAVLLRRPVRQPNLLVEKPAAKSKPYQSLSQPTQKPHLADRLRDRWYPVFGGLARTFWPLGLGQPFLASLVRLGWIEKSADTKLNPAIRLTHWQAKLAHEQLTKLPVTPLREPKFVRNREKLLAELLRNGYNFHEIWYDTPVAPARYASEADFPTDKCPETVRATREIINLPTWYDEKRLQKARQIISRYELSEGAES